MPRPVPFVLRTALAFILVAGPARVAQAAECTTDADCGHGFACEPGPISGGSGGASSGTGGAAGTSGSSVGGAMAGGSFVPAPPPPVCGNGLCDVTETATSCAADCAPELYCALGPCLESADCAEGYVCELSSPPGTGGGPNAPFCGDGICTTTETSANCPADCSVTGRCAPEAGVCATDADCVAGFYCALIGAGTGGSTGSGGAMPAAGGTLGGSGGSTGGQATGGAFAMGGQSGGSSGTGSSGTGSGGAPDPGDAAGAGGAKVAVGAGTCMPRDDGTGGASGSAGTVGTGGFGTGGTGIGVTGGTGSGAVSGTSAGGTTAGDAGTGAVGGGTAGTGSGARSGGGGAGESSTGGSNATGSGGTATANDDEARGVERGGCSVSATGRRAPYSELGLAAIVLARLLRRRRSR